MDSAAPIMAPLRAPTEPGTPSTPTLTVENLAIGFRAQGTWVEVVSDVSFRVYPGETVALVGESGSGKTVTAMSLVGLVPALGGRVLDGRVSFQGEDVTHVAENRWRRIRGRHIGMIFQQPTRALDPSFTVGDQIAEPLIHHLGLSRRAARARAIELLDRVHIPRPEERSRVYPHELSGGMAQRVMIAAALACNPELLIADEPTTALDVTVQSRILDLLEELRRDAGMAMVFITHDLSVVAEIADRVAVLYAGQTVEEATAEELFAAPRHPYAAGLLCGLRPRRAGERLEAIPGQVPAPHLMPAGCHFAPRCPHAVEVCRAPQTTQMIDGRLVRCGRATTLRLRGIDH